MVTKSKNKRRSFPGRRSPGGGGGGQAVGGGGGTKEVTILTSPI